jgi:hypothetical protein
MTVIIINEDNHGMIGVAKNYESAVKFLINGYWIEDNSEICDGEDSWIKLIDYFGEDWIDKMVLDWDINHFNNFWDGSFYLNEIEVYEK